MPPFFFGDSKAPLYGFHDVPAAAAPSCAAGVVLCHSLCNQYMRMHWAFVQLGVSLARRGVHVLRFDYHGCGDSAGETMSGGPKVWEENIVTAVNELRDMSGVERVHLVGYEFGAPLAARASSRLEGVETLVLWNPVTDGRECLARVRQIQRDMLRRRGRSSDAQDDELLGYRLPGNVCTRVASLDLSAYDTCAAARAVIVASGTESEGALADRLQDRGITVTQRAIEKEDVWQELAFTARAQVETRVLGMLADVLCGEHA